METRKFVPDTNPGYSPLPEFSYVNAVKEPPDNVINLSNIEEIRLRTARQEARRIVNLEKNIQLLDKLGADAPDAYGIEEKLTSLILAKARRRDRIKYSCDLRIGDGIPFLIGDTLGVMILEPANIDYDLPDNIIHLNQADSWTPGYFDKSPIPSNPKLQASGNRLSLGILINGQTDEKKVSISTPDRGASAEQIIEGCSIKIIRKDGDELSIHVYIDKYIPRPEISTLYNSQKEA